MSFIHVNPCISKIYLIPLKYYKGITSQKGERKFRIRLCGEVVIPSMMRPMANTDYQIILLDNRKRTISNIAIETEKWQKYFEEIDQATDREEGKEAITNTEQDEKEEELAYTEVKEKMYKLKSRKTAGKGGICAEPIKYGGEKMTLNGDNITIEDLERLSADQLYEFIDGITDDMVDISDIEGNSDVEDNVLVSTPSGSSTPRSSNVLIADPSSSSTPGPSRPSRQRVRNKSLLNFEKSGSDMD
ncbi:unnamed protein product [Diabrotica balteata]|uniref:Uncharacterized protein n=1 Tax=Diabrotica balteata TaxID=107213 RepID=A0A9N9TD24_DIABA|nr:unnamed protein product [Diabrotica balteata]